MVMKLNTGVPGSGKTYLMVKSFIDLFCRWDKDTQLFVLKDEHKDKILVSNIEGLTLPHLDIETMMNERCMQLAKTKFIDSVSKFNVSDIKKIKDPMFKDFLLDQADMQDVIDEYYYQYLAEKIRWFFEYNYQKQLADKHGPIIYLIEESQRYFDAKELGRQKWVRDVHYFFEKHRHFGFSIFCDTQHFSKISKGIAVLFETETRAKPRTLSLMGEFKYNEYSDGAKINQVPIVVKPDKRVYSTYKSMSHKEDVKTKKPALKLFVFVVAMIIASGFILNYAKSNLGPKEAHAKSSSPGGTKKGNPSDPNLSNQGEQIIKEWMVLSHVLYDSGEVEVVHPLTNELINIRQLNMPVKQRGRELMCLMPVNGKM